ncbi:hypothetical protein EGW08_011393 [Elysia chlorotica]|uniref:LITAF domain-containing protein n=1 Tax=Elysia chlorotica TaxID=188477 RepID=A0A433TGX0_ELYCH|nr:hypothetical protein EGW08_011393 [Elysia chlorotica]
MSGYPAGPPPPYSGTNDMAGAAYPPPAPTYSDPSKGYSGGLPPNQPYYAWQGYGMSGYSDPAMSGGGYSQPYGGDYSHSATTVAVTQPTLAVTQMFRELPVRCKCPHCQADVQTGTHYETGTLTWILCAVIFIVGFFCGCCFIPFCIDSAKDVVHTCPSCRQQIGRYNRL